MSGRTALRFAIEAAFLVGVAAVVAALELSVPVILVAIFAAWAVAASFEWSVTRGRIGLRPRAPTEAPPARPEKERPTAAAAAGGLLARLGRASESPVAAETSAGPEPAAEEPAPEPEPAVVQESGVPPEEPVEVVAVSPPSTSAAAEAAATDGGEATDEAAPTPEPEGEPAAEAPAPEPSQPARVLSAVPPPPPEPEPETAPAAEPEPAPVVVALTPRGPREWNLWDLERLTRAAAGKDAFRDEERSYLLVYLREFAGPDGLLPVDFDGLVRESFGELVGTG